MLNIKKYSILALVFILVGIFYMSNGFAQDYELVWSDEFDGTELDLSKWEHQIGIGNPAYPGWGNNELEYYRAENTTVSDGLLTITAKKQDFQGSHYTSSRIRTMNKGDWTYGKIEIRAKMPIGQGIWPALWMMPTDDEYGGWASSGEIDIMEYLGHEPSTVHGTLHYGGAWPDNAHSGTFFTLPEGNFNDDFHVFTLEWQRGKIKWFVDGELYQTQTLWWTSGGNFPAPFNKRFHIIINMAVGGNWPGPPDETTEFPQQLLVDYVRVYQVPTTGIGDANEQTPVEYSLDQNYPNPFNSSTTISYHLQKSGKVMLELFNLQGRKVANLVHKEQNAGSYSVNFDASGLSTGVYWCRLVTTDNSYYRKLLYLQ